MRTRLSFLCPRSRSQSGQRSKSCFSNNSKTTEANLMKLHRNIEHNEKVCRAQELGLYAQGQGHNQVRGHIVTRTRLSFLCPRSRSQSGQRSKSCFSNNSKTTEANLMKLHRNIEHNEKVCRAQELGLYAQGQGHSQVRGHIVMRTRLSFLCPRSRSQSGQRSKSCFSNNSKTTEANLMKLHRNIEHNEKVCRAQELGLYAQGQGHNQVRGHIVTRTRLSFLCPRSRSQSGQRSKSCFSNNSKTTEANLMKLHRNIEHNEKVCRAQEIGL